MWTVIPPEASGYYWILNGDRTTQVVYRDAKKGITFFVGDDAHFEDHQIGDCSWWKSPLVAPPRPEDRFISIDKRDAIPEHTLTVKLRNKCGHDLPAYTRVVLGHDDKHQTVALSVAPINHTGLVGICAAPVSRNGVAVFSVWSETPRKKG